MQGRRPIAHRPGDAAREDTRARQANLPIYRLVVHLPLARPDTGGFGQAGPAAGRRTAVEGGLAWWTPLVAIAALARHVAGTVVPSERPSSWCWC